MSESGSVSTVTISRTDADTLATLLGYLVGFGSLLLYTPIAIRLIRQWKAAGLTLNTWWLKLFSYTFTYLYSYSHGYSISTYVETLINTFQAAVILLLVAYLQNHFNPRFILSVIAYLVCVVWLMISSGGGGEGGDGSMNNNTSFVAYIIGSGFSVSAFLNTGALVPQFLQNAKRRSSGDYSPLTATMAILGCSARVFTTIQLNGSDPWLLFSFLFPLACNGLLLAQILYYGTMLEGQTLFGVFVSDVYVTKKHQRNDEEEQNISLTS